MSKEYKYSDIIGAVIGSAMAVHSALGNGFVFRKLFINVVWPLNSRIKILITSEKFLSLYIIKATPLVNEA